MSFFFLRISWALSIMIWFRFKLAFASSYISHLVLFSCVDNLFSDHSFSWDVRRSCSLWLLLIPHRFPVWLGFVHSISLVLFFHMFSWTHLFCMECFYFRCPGMVEVLDLFLFFNTSIWFAYFLSLHLVFFSISRRIHFFPWKLW
jgi:hypothetical protein